MTSIESRPSPRLHAEHLQPRSKYVGHLWRIVQLRRQALDRSRITAFRLNLERLESRELLTIPLPPTGVVAIGISVAEIELSWNASTDPTVTGYDVTEQTWVVTGGGKGSHGGHYVYTTIATNVTTNSYTVTGLATGSFHTYLVTALNSSGPSLYSLPGVTGETWFAPSLASALLPVEQRVRVLRPGRRDGRPDDPDHALRQRQPAHVLRTLRAEDRFDRSQVGRGELYARQQRGGAGQYHVRGLELARLGHANDPVQRHAPPTPAWPRPS